MRNLLAEARSLGTQTPAAQTAGTAETRPIGPPHAVPAVSAITAPAPHHAELRSHLPGNLNLSQPERSERAAIVEHDGRVPRHWAEGLARLHPDRPPRGFTPSRWLEVVNDSGLLLDRWGTTLEALGSTDADVWGCDAAAPDQRLDLAGLAVEMSAARCCASPQARRPSRQPAEP